MKRLHKEYEAVCGLFQKTPSMEGFSKYVADQKASGVGAATHEGGSTVEVKRESDFEFLLPKKRVKKEKQEAGEGEDEDEGEEVSAPRKSIAETELLRACHTEFGTPPSKLVILSQVVSKRVPYFNKFAGDRAHDGRIEPLLLVTAQEGALKKYVAAVQKKVGWSNAATPSYVRGKARGFINNNRTIWRVGRWHTSKSGECTWEDPKKLHPYTTLMAELEEPVTCTERKNSCKMEALRKLEGFEQEEFPELKSDCLQGDARVRLGKWNHYFLHDLGIHLQYARTIFMYAVNILPKYSYNSSSQFAYPWHIPAAYL